MNKKKVILGIDTSCDDTAVGLYHEINGMLAHITQNQYVTHSDFGGVVPELAARDHIIHIANLTKTLLANCNLKVSDLAKIAYTKGPGLMSCLLVGNGFAKSLAYAAKCQAIGVNHIEGHLFSAFIDTPYPPPYPFLALIVSGGHTLLIEANSLGNYRLLGETLDDAVGEAFDKTAKLLNLGFPGGANLANLAMQGNNTFNFPRPLQHSDSLDFSFSGLKTAVARAIQAEPICNTAQAANLACSFEQAAVDCLYLKVQQALKNSSIKDLVVAGGVAANKHLRTRIQTLAKQNNVTLHLTPLEYCTDNGAMIAYLGYLYANSADNNHIIAPQARWPLTTKD